MAAIISSQPPETDSAYSANAASPITPAKRPPAETLSAAPVNIAGFDEAVIEPDIEPGIDIVADMDIVPFFGTTIRLAPFEHWAIETAERVTSTSEAMPVLVPQGAAVIVVLADWLCDRQQLRSTEVLRLRKVEKVALTPRQSQRPSRQVP